MATDKCKCNIGSKTREAQDSWTHNTGRKMTPPGSTNNQAQSLGERWSDMEYTPRQVHAELQWRSEPETPASYTLNKVGRLRGVQVTVQPNSDITAVHCPKNAPRNTSKMLKSMQAQVTKFQWCTRRETRPRHLDQGHERARCKTRSARSTDR
eukprot:6162069-Amphidinium_carterae.2